MSSKRARNDAMVPGGGPNLRFPGYDVLSEVDTWDAVTAGVGVGGRGAPPPLPPLPPPRAATAYPLLHAAGAGRRRRALRPAAGSALAAEGAGARARRCSPGRGDHRRLAL